MGGQRRGGGGGGEFDGSGGNDHRSNRERWPLSECDVKDYLGLLEYVVDDSYDDIFNRTYPSLMVVENLSISSYQDGKHFLLFPNVCLVFSMVIFSGRIISPRRRDEPRMFSTGKKEKKDVALLRR